MKTSPKADQTVTSRFGKVEGKKLHYLTARPGPALILLHGYTQTSRMWRPLIHKLKDRFTVIAPDLPGIGDSDIPKGGCDMKTAAIRNPCACEIDRRYEGESRSGTTSA